MNFSLAIHDIFCYWAQGGVVLVPIVVVCFLIWFYVLRMLARLKKMYCPSARLEESIKNRLAEGESWESVTDYVAQISSFYCHVYFYVVGKIVQGLSLVWIFDEIRKKEFAPFRRDLGMLHALVTAAPLLGLLGTIWGMIETFHVIALKAAYTSDLIASGISKAMITTQLGLLVALPGIFGITAIRRRLRQIEVQFMTLEMHLSLVSRKIEKQLCENEKRRG